MSSSADHTCDLCKVTYATDNELQDHNWSLMHHIKIEKIKKGAPHSCNLCMESCTNLIEYGKHLNEDRHKLALSRRGKEGTEILDSFSTQSELFTTDHEDTSLHAQGYFQDSAHTEHRGLQGFRGTKQSVNKHSRSFSQPELFRKGPDRQYKPNPNQPTYLAENSWQPVQPENTGYFKKPQGHGGHSRTHSDWGYNDKYPQQQHDFHSDNYQNINWNDNNFYDNVQFNPYHWHQNAHQNNHQEQGRRGSFDSNMYRNTGTQRNDNRDKYEQPHDRGRRPTRGKRGKGRAHSYDNISPESTSSSDSGLKRRLENNDRLDSGKSRRRYSPERFSASDTSYHNSSRYRSEESSDRSSRSQTEEQSERHTRSRSSSRDPYKVDNRHRSRVESIERPSSRNSDKKVSWSDQHQVSSTTDLTVDDLNHSGSSCNKKRSQMSKHQTLPDSSSESETTKGQKSNMHYINKRSNRKSSPRSQRKNPVGVDQTETVLEKAEKLCKKLRNDREKAKQKKQAEEKKKKYEKHREINEKLESLKERGSQHITGVLEAQMSFMSGKSSTDIYKPDRQTEEPELSMLSSCPSSTYSDMEVTQLIPERLTSTPKPTPSVSSVSSHDSTRNTPTPSSVSQRISQTKADIDAIRAKIESSVSKVVHTPMPTSTESPISTSRQATSEQNSPVGRYPQKAERNSLRKMVNSPRTTKERLQLAEMLREHAKSQKKLSLPRFNLKFSDLCNDSERQDEQVNIDTLAPSVQLEIANIIEADEKPDITELEKLLDMASAGNCQLDMNILTDLGVPAPPAQTTVTSPIILSPEVTARHSTQRTPTPVERNNTEVHSETSRPKRTFLSEIELLCQREDEARKSPSPHNLLEDLSSNKGYEWMGMADVNEIEGGISLPSQEPRSWKVSEHTKMLDHRQTRAQNDAESKQGLSYEDMRSESTHSAQKQSKDRRPADTEHKSRSWNVSDQRPKSSHSTIESLLSHDDLRITQHVQKQGKGVRDRPTDSHLSDNHRFSSSLPAPSGAETNTRTLSSSMNIPDPIITIKQEKIDDGYDKAVSSALTKANDYFKKPQSHPDEGVTLSGSDTATEETVNRDNRDLGYNTINTGRFSPVRKSIHTQKLYGGDDIHTQKLYGGDDIHTQKLYGGDDIPERDRCSSQPQLYQSDSRTTLEKVTSILDGAPAPRVDSGTKSSLTNTSNKTPVENTRGEVQHKDKHLDSSQHSQSSILDEIYNVSVSEESVRQEISTVNFKISKLKSLIQEASQELNKCAEQKNNLMEQEHNYRTKRLKLLEESRSSSACSQASANMFSAENLSRIQVENPVMLKFLLSQQRQSDLSSVGGYSNVETGSQPDTPRDPERRGSVISNVSEPVSLPGEQTGPINTNTLFSQSIDALSGSSESLMSVFTKQQTGVRKTDGTIEISDEKEDDSAINTNTDNLNASNSISLLKNPLEKVGFVTLDALMKGDMDIGRLLNKSIESIEKGTIPEGASPLEKQSSNESAATSGTACVERERRDSTFSIDTGSDSEKKSLSLKYMGTLPEGTNYESLVRQVSAENKNKSVMFTVFSSPEAMSQLRKNPDAGTTPVVKEGDSNKGAQTGYKSDESTKTNSTHTLTHYSDVESQSVKSGYSLGEQIKRICDEQGSDHTMEVDVSKHTDDAKGISYNGIDLTDTRHSPVKDCFVKLDRVDVSSRASTKNLPYDTQSPTRKKLKSKKERDQLSRRKQKENFILQSDTNSEAELDTSKTRTVATITTLSEDDMVQSGSEDRTPRVPAVSEVKRSLLDEVQLETETHSDSCEDSQKYSTIQYLGPSGLSAACIQEYKGDLYVCYNGSELRRFDLQTGRILKELDCTPYLVNCLHVTKVEDVGDVLYTAGSCKKLMAFEPQKFDLITAYDYTESITCLHENWGRLFIGFADGSISVRSLKVLKSSSDKELNSFSCTTSRIHCVRSASAGMTKMLCLATGDKVIYVLDAITGLLITMLEGHTKPPICLQVSGDKVISGGTDRALMIHSCTTGELIKMCQWEHQPITCIWYKDDTIYATGSDHIVRTYNFSLKPGATIHGSDKSSITCGMTQGDLVILGKNDGHVKAIQMKKVTKWYCKFGTCRLHFDVFHQYKLHVMNEHYQDKICCSHMNCSHTFTNQDDKQKHILQHILKNKS